MPLSLYVLGLVADAFYGIAIGSFLNVVIWRVPRGGSVATPTWSYCPNCEHRLLAADLVPLLSFLALGRRCRYCKSPISWRYFLVEALTGACFVLIYLRYGASIDTFFYSVFSAILICILFIDLDCFIIPDELSFIALLVGVGRNLYWIFLGKRPDQWANPLGIPLPNSIFAAVVCACIFHAISFIGYLVYTRDQGAATLMRRCAWFGLQVLDDYAYLGAKFLCLGYVSPKIRSFIDKRESCSAEHVDTGQTREEIAAQIENEEEQTGMGQGDAKLAGAIGAMLFLPVACVSFMLSIGCGALVGVALILSRMAGRRSAIPFGPYLVAGAYSALFFGHDIYSWYSGFLHGG